MILLHCEDKWTKFDSQNQFNGSCLKGLCALRLGHYKVELQFFFLFWGSLG